MSGSLSGQCLDLDPSSCPHERPVSRCQPHSSPHGELQAGGVAGGQALHPGEHQRFLKRTGIRFGIGDDREMPRELEVCGHLRGGDSVPPLGLDQNVAELRTPETGNERTVIPQALQRIVGFRGRLVLELSGDRRPSRSSREPMRSSTSPVSQLPPVQSVQPESLAQGAQLPDCTVDFRAFRPFGRNESGRRRSPPGNEHFLTSSPCMTLSSSEDRCVFASNAPASIMSVP